MQKEILRVYCSPVQDTYFPKMRFEIEKAVLHALGQKGKPPPLAILFSEYALGHRYDISQHTVTLAAQRMQSLLPPGHFTAVAFNVLQQNHDYLSNMGYLIARDSNLHWQPHLCRQPKRTFAVGDYVSVSGFYHSTPYNGDHLKIWDPRGEKLASGNKPMLSLHLPDGQKLEYCVCADVNWAAGAGRQDNAITLVSAHDIVKSEVALLSLCRNAVIANDGNEHAPVVKSSQRSTLYFESNKHGDFNIVSLYQKSELMH
ncbi:MAG: hypothetical protein NT051_05955 [Candidatus Micrarchaeota archaeon]|nr:hypothetical protein [Candidatus Micrarchaeota archaeon]